MGYSDKREAQKFHFKNNDSLYSCVVILSVNNENTLIIGMWRVNIIANIKRQRFHSFSLNLSYQFPIFMLLVNSSVDLNVKVVQSMSSISCFTLGVTCFQF